MYRLILVLSCVIACACSRPSNNSADTGAGAGDPDLIATDASVEMGPEQAYDGSTDVTEVGPDLEPGPSVAMVGALTIEGAYEDGLHVFRGIPYAEPPLGELRFAYPLPYEGTGTFDATRFGERCLQPNIAFTSLQGSEDCLTLNVWTAQLSSAEKAPVMVWFHGGAFVQGSATEKTYHGHDLAQHGVVVVTANYRLGPLGFTTHPGLTGDGGPVVNAGLADQLLVLDWVQQHIAAFGGDPENVTVFGESAGGIATCALISAGQAEGRFQRAILQSGPCTQLLALPDVPTANAQAEALGQAVGCDAADPGFADCMRAADAETLTSALGFRPGVVFGDGAAWTPVRDGTTVPLDVDAALASASPGVDIIAGSNADEGSIVLVGVSQGVVTVDYQAATTQMFGADADAVRARYPVADFGGEAEAIAAIFGDQFVCGTRRVARLRRQAGAGVWLYHFAHPFVTPIGDLGAMHGAELPFVFGTELTLVKLRPDEEPLSELMQRYWTRFAATGDPNGGADFVWPVYEAATDRHVVLDLPASEGAALRSEDCDFWDSL